MDSASPKEHATEISSDSDHSTEVTPTTSSQSFFLIISLFFQELMTSERLRTVLSIILALGNFMNGGNRTRGQADGFGLEILPKLRDVKSSDSSVTLLHFIVRSYMKKCSEPETALPPVPEPADIDRASAVLFDDLSADLQSLRRQLEGET